MNRVAAALEGARESDVHPLLKIRPCRKILVGAPHRFVGRHRLDLVPASERGAPLPIECAQAVILVLQPLAHCSQREIGKIEVPERRQVANAGFVTETIIERPIRVQRPHAADQTVVNFIQPFRVGKARLTHKRGAIAGVRPIAPFGFEKSPVYRAIIVPLVIGRIKIGRNIFEIAAQISLDQTGKAGHRGACFIAVVGLHHSGVDPELF